MADDPNKQADSILAALEAQEGYESLATGLWMYKAELEIRGFSETQAMEILLDFRTLLMLNNPPANA